MRLVPELTDRSIISGSTEDRVLHEQEIPVQLVYLNRERETRTSSLIIKVKSRTDSGQKATSFRVEILDEQNPLFLYTVSISENEFLELKSDQNLIIDYSQFHIHFIDILQRVQGPPSRYEARLVLSKNPQEFAEFAIHEISEFRRLDQLKLKAVQATDATLKDHLSLNIKSLKMQCLSLQTERNELERTLRQKESELLNLQREYTDSLKAFEAQKNSMMLEFSDKLSSSKEEAAKLQRKAEVEFNEEKRQLELDYKRQLSEMSSKFELVQMQNQELSQANFNLSHSAENLQVTLKAKTKELDHSLSEQSRLNTLKESLDSQALNLERDLGRVSSRVAFLEQQLIDKEALCQKVQSLLDASNEQKIHLEQSFKLLKDSSQKDERRLSECIKEIKKGNQIIQNLQNELKVARSKQKMTGTVIVKQETILEKNKKELESLGDTILELRSTSQKLQSDLQEKDATISDLKKELERSKEMITQYQSMLGKFSEQSMQEKDAPRISRILPNRQGIYQSTMLSSAPSLQKSFDGLHPFSPASKTLQSRLEYNHSHYGAKTPIRPSTSYTGNSATSAFFPSAVPAPTPR